jgi:hypothetical protein
MNTEQREALRQDVLRWIQSREFDSYLGDLHPETATPTSFFRRALGMATNGLRQRYLELAQSGQVVRANIWMANSGLINGEVNCAPALLIAGADGTDDADNFVGYLTAELDGTEMRPPTSDELEVRSMLGDEKFNLFRVRTLPLSVSHNYPVHLFDTMLHSSVVAGGEMKEMPMVVCLVHPQMEPAILPIPSAIVAPHDIPVAPVFADSRNPELNQAVVAYAGKHGLDWRPAPQENLDKLAAGGLPESVLEFYRYFDPQQFLYGIQFRSSYALEEFWIGVDPAGTFRKLGFIPFALTLGGDALCFDMTALDKHEMPAIVIFPKEVFFDVNDGDLPPERVDQMKKLVGRNLSDFLNLAAKDEADLKPPEYLP